MRSPIIWIARPAYSISSASGIFRCRADAPGFRVRPNREFFEIAPQRAITALKIAGGEDVTPHRDIAEDEDAVKALNRATTRKSNISLKVLGILPGSLLTYYDDETITAEVVDDRRILFEEETSLSAAALKILHRKGFEWQSARGALYWRFEDEKLVDRLTRMEQEDLSAAANS